MGAEAHRVDNLVLRELLAAQILVHQGVVKLGGGLDQVAAPLLRILHILRGDRLVNGAGARLLLDVAHLAHLHKVDDALEVGSLVNGNADRHRIRAKNLADLGDD